MTGRREHDLWLRWLRERREADPAMLAPHPPRKPKVEMQPITLAGVEQWAERFNAWVRICWRQHPTMAQWAAAEIFDNTPLGASVLLIRPRGSREQIAMNFRGYKPADRGSVSLDRLRWAARVAP